VIDLSNYSITETEENPWFLSDIPLKFTFPFEIDLDDELDQAFGFLSSHQTSPETLYPLIYQNQNEIEQAELEIEEVNGRKVTVSFTYGLEQLPSWEKKLSELSLDNFDLEDETIYEHALSVISQTWPAVNYNFPLIHIDTIDTEEELWLSFKSRINDYNGVEFPDNFVDDTTYAPINRNIIQPLAYALHILTQGLLEAGLTLEGDILSDERLTKKCIYTPKEYYLKREDQELDLFLYNTEYEFKYSPPTNLRYPIGYFEKTQDVPRGRFNILGTVTITDRLFSSDPGVFYRIFFDGVQISSGGSGSFSIDLEIINNENINKAVTIEANSLVRMINPNVDVSLLEEDEFHVVVDLQILPLERYDVDGNSIPTIINENKVDLTKAVPDITFGDYFKAILNWYNYDYEIKNGIITMNKVEDQINYQNAVDLSEWEVKEPLKTYRKGFSYLLQFQDSTNDFGYTFDKVFQSASGVLNSGFKTNEKTTPIEIAALPLPLIERNGSVTAHAFETNETKIYAVIYDGLTNNRNICKDPTNILLPAVHAASWFKWFSFRINAQEFRWNFKAWSEQLAGLKAKGKAFAYGRYHIIKKIQKTELKHDLYEVEVELESME
jgi:hypothetical protein